MAKTRTEIDKELMYQKIMPTAARKTAAVQPEKPETVAAGTSSPSTMTMPTAAGMARAIGRTSVPLPFQEKREMILVNLMEDIVFEKLDATLVRFNCCKCNRCKKDIAALALNRLQPRYVVMEKDDKDRRKMAEESYGSEVTSALVQAILLVKKEPRH